MLNVNWADVAIQIGICIALVNWIKTLAKDKLGSWAMLVSMGVAFIVVFLASYVTANSFVVLDYVKQSIIVGLASCGLYDLRQGYVKQ